MFGFEDTFSDFLTALFAFLNDFLNGLFGFLANFFGGLNIDIS
jgi:hypothetical protein